MKTRLFTLALLLAASLGGYAQDKASLKAATQKMIDLSDQENYNDLSGTVYPKIYSIVSRDEYLTQLEKKMKGPDYTIHMIRIDPSIDYGSIKTVDNMFFCVVNYDNMMTIEFKDQIAPKDREAKENYFKKLLGTEDVYYIEATNTIDAKKRIQLVAIADESSHNQWTFLDPKSPAAAQIMHEAIRKELDPENTEEAAQTVQEAAAPKTDKYTEAKKAEEVKKNSVKNKS